MISEVWGGKDDNKSCGGLTSSTVQDLPATGISNGRTADRMRRARIILAARQSFKTKLRIRPED